MIFFNFKICLRMGWFKKIKFFSITSSYNLFSFFYSQNQLLQFIYRIINFLARLILEFLLMFLKILLLVFLFHFRFFSNSFVQNIRIFKSWNDFHYAILFLFVIIKGVVPKPSIFFWIPFELLEQLLYFLVELNCFLPKEQLLSLMNLLDNDPKNPSDWVISQIWALESFKSNHILLLSAFLSFVFLSCCQW